MTQIVRAADGTIHSFPDEATPDMISQALGLGAATPEPNLGDKIKSLLAPKDYAYRGKMWPFGVTQEGKTELATPSFIPSLVESLAKSAVLPGRAMLGEPYNAGDVAGLVANFALPMTMGVPGRALFRSQSVAPTTEELATRASAAFDQAGLSGVVIKPEKYAEFVAGAQRLLDKEGADPLLHPKLVGGVFKSMSNRVGQSVDVNDLQTIRRQIGIAERSTAPELADERRIAGELRRSLDSMVENLTSSDMVTGATSNPETLAPTLANARSLWQMTSKSDTIETLVNRAQISAASKTVSLDQALRNEFSAMLKNPKAMRGWSADEVDAIKNIAEGNLPRHIMRLLGMFDVSKGGHILQAGAAGGGLIVGTENPGNAVIPIIAGYIGARGADKAALNAANAARDLVARGGTDFEPTHLGRRIVGPVAAEQMQGGETSLDVPALLRELTAPETTPRRRGQIVEALKERAM